MRKIPDPLDTVFHQLLRNILRACLRDGQHCNFDLMLPNKVLQTLHGKHSDSSHIPAHQLRILVKHPLENKPSPLKIHIIAKSPPKVAGADNYKIVLLIQSQYLSNLIVKILHIITVTLLAKSPEIIKVLTDLGCRHLHQFAQILGRYPLHTLILQFSKISEIPGQTSDDCL